MLHSIPYNRVTHLLSELLDLSVAAEPTHPIFNRSMSPRQPTTGEEYLDAGDYNVKFCRNEIEIKFTVLTLFDNFKTVLLNRQPFSLYICFK